MQSQLPHVRLENFEGPFDLLIELARSRKLDLADVSLQDITEAFLEYVREVPVPVALQGDFAVVAAILLGLKVQQLTPDASHDEDVEAYELSDRVRMYELYRKQAEFLQATWGDRRLFTSRKLVPQVKEYGDMPEVSVENMLGVFESVIARAPKPIKPRAHLTSYGRTLKEWLSDIEERVAKTGRVHYQEVVAGSSTRDQAVSFLAILQLARDERVGLEQEAQFEDLFVSKVS